MFFSLQQVVVDMTRVCVFLLPPPTSNGKSLWDPSDLFLIEYHRCPTLSNRWTCLTHFWSALLLRPRLWKRRKAEKQKTELYLTVYIPNPKFQKWFAASARRLESPRQLPLRLTNRLTKKQLTATQRKAITVFPPRSHHQNLGEEKGSKRPKHDL